VNSDRKNDFVKGALSFPKNFLWGVATSHFQVEGNPLEITNRLSDWSKWTEDPSHIVDQTTADQACEFYERFSSDIDLVSQLNLNAFRIGINWAAICPEPPPAAGEIKVNADMIAYYRQVLKTAKDKNIKTFVTIFHFSLPNWLVEMGGWADERVVSEFSKFAELACRELGDLVDFWQTINEPMVYAYHGYITGSWPPGFKHQYLKCFHVIRNLLAGHAAAYRAIHSVQNDAQVGYTMHWQAFTPSCAFNPLDIFIARNRDAVFNHLFPSAVQTGSMELPFPFNNFKVLHKLMGPIAGLKDSSDYLGINYYTRDLSEFSFTAPFLFLGVRSTRNRMPVNALGWETFPDGLYKLLTSGTAPYQKDSQGKTRPIYITENGYASEFPYNKSIADGDWSVNDDDRCEYLKTHLLAVYKAIQAGIDIRGYLHWSLLDNFEWAEGLRMRFGLVRVAYPGQERTLRKSARLYSQIAQTNALPPIN